MEEKEDTLEQFSITAFISLQTCSDLLLHLWVMHNHRRTDIMQSTNIDDNLVPEIFDTVMRTHQGFFDGSWNWTHDSKTSDEAIMPPLQRSPQVVGSFKRVSAQPRSLQLIFFSFKPFVMVGEKNRLALSRLDWMSARRGCCLKNGAFLIIWCKAAKDDDACQTGRLKDAN